MIYTGLKINASSKISAISKLDLVICQVRCENQVIFKSLTNYLQIPETV